MDRGVFGASAVALWVGPLGHCAWTQAPRRRPRGPTAVTSNELLGLQQSDEAREIADLVGFSYHAVLRATKPEKITPAQGQIPRAGVGGVVLSRARVGIAR